MEDSTDGLQCESTVFKWIGKQRNKSIASNAMRVFAGRVSSGISISCNSRDLQGVKVPMPKKPIGNDIRG